MILLLLILVGCSRAEKTCGDMFVPDPVVFSRPGDIQLAYVGQLSTSTNGFCDTPRKTGVKSDSLAFQHADLVPYALSQIRKNEKILPNVTVGFTVLDGCARWHATLARVWTLLLDTCHGIRSGVASGKLVGMIGPVTSSTAMMISGSLGIHKIPHIGLQATSDELSDDSR